MSITPQFLFFIIIIMQFYTVCHTYVHAHCPGSSQRVRGVCTIICGYAYICVQEAMYVNVYVCLPCKQRLAVRMISSDKATKRSEKKTKEACNLVKELCCKRTSFSCFTR